jgi:hypothetical protein
MHTMKHKVYMQCGTKSLKYSRLLKLKLLQFATSFKVMATSHCNFFALTLIHWSFEVRDSSKLQNNFKLVCCLKIKAQANNNKKSVNKTNIDINSHQSSNDEWKLSSIVEQRSNGHSFWEKLMGNDQCHDRIVASVGHIISQKWS